MSQAHEIDLRVRRHGTIWMFEPLTQRAKDHAANVMDIQDWQWLGPAFGVDHRLAFDLVTALEDEGFEVES